MLLSSTMLPSSCSDLQLSMLPLFTIALASPYAAIFFSLYCFSFTLCRPCVIKNKFRSEQRMHLLQVIHF